MAPQRNTHGSRRIFFKQTGALLAAASAASQVIAKENKAGKASTELIYNSDTNHIFHAHHDNMAPEKIDEYVQLIADTGTTIYVQDVCAQRTNFASRVWDSWLTGFEPEAGPDDPFYRGTRPETISRDRKMRLAMLKLQKTGVDFVERSLSQARKRGMTPWVSMRMNDHHSTIEPRVNIVSSFWLKHPEYRRHPQRKASRVFQTLDFAESQVREHYLKLVDELLERYDFDGLDLNYLRSPFCFKIGHEWENRRVMTEFIRQIHARVSSAAQRRGHPITISVRVPSEPGRAIRFGLDVGRWARERLINFVIASAGYADHELDVDTPVGLWKDLLEPYGVKFAVTLLPSQYRYPGARGFWKQDGQYLNPDGPTQKGGQYPEPDAAIGAAIAALYAGADGIELFNYFPTRVLNMGRGWTLESYKRTLRAMRSVEKMKPLRRKHFVGCRQITAPGELISHNPLVPRTGNWELELANGQYFLPVEGVKLAFRLQTGPQPIGRKVQVVIGMEDSLPKGKDGEQLPLVLVNDVACRRLPTGPDKLLATYDVPAAALADGEHVIEVHADTQNGSKSVRVTRVEFIVHAAS